VKRLVGPVLTPGQGARAIVAAIEQPGANEDVVVVDRGGYVRVTAVAPCVAKRAAIEEALGGPFSFKRDLEPIMTSFRGRLEIDANDEEVRWL
jgi:toluene monooxygenase system protein D